MPVHLMLKGRRDGHPVAFLQTPGARGAHRLAPGTAFGAGGEQYLRLCYAQGEDRLTRRWIVWPDS